MMLAVGKWLAEPLIGAGAGLTGLGLGQLGGRAAGGAVQLAYMEP